MENKQSYTFEVVQQFCLYKKKRRMIEGITCNHTKRTDMLPDCCEKDCPHIQEFEKKKRTLI